MKRSRPQQESAADCLVARRNQACLDKSIRRIGIVGMGRVATSVLTPGQVRSPIRGILRNQQNTTVIWRARLGSPSFHGLNKQETEEVYDC